MKIIDRLFRRHQAVEPSKKGLRQELTDVRARLDVAITDATNALAQAINTQRTAEAQLSRAQQAAEHGEDRLELSRARRSLELVTQADRERRAARADIARLTPIVTERRERTERLKAGLENLRRRRSELDDRSADMLARDAIASAQEALAAITGNLALDDAERHLRRREALAGARLELVTDPFEELT